MNKERIVKLFFAAIVTVFVAAFTLIPVKEVKAESASQNNIPVISRDTWNVVTNTVFDHLEENAREAAAREAELREEDRQAKIDEEVAQYVASQSVPENKTVSIEGMNVKTTVDGLYLAKSVEGVAITTPKSEIASGLGVSEGDVKVSTWDVSPKKSAAAYKLFEDCTKAFNDGGTTAVMGPSFQINVFPGNQKGKALDPTQTFETYVQMPAGFIEPNAEYVLVYASSNGTGVGTTVGFQMINSLTDIQGNSIHITGYVGYGAYSIIKLVG